MQNNCLRQEGNSRHSDNNIRYVGFSQIESNPKMKTIQSRLFLLLGIIAILHMVSCNNHSYTPKPAAYLRLDMPEKSYSDCDTSILPFSFRYADEALILLKKNTPGMKWVDLAYPSYNGVIYLSYIPLRGPQDLKGQIDTSYELLKPHFSYSSGVDEQNYVDLDNHIYATTYHLKGQNVASTYQFWATDSVHHFLRGALYLNTTPNNDSLAPILDYLQEDIDSLIVSLRWR